MSAGLKAAREAARERILAGRADREAAIRYRELAEKNPSLRVEYLKRAAAADAIADWKLRSKA